MARPRNDGMEDRQLFGSGAQSLASTVTEPAVPEPLAELLGAGCPRLPPAGQDFLERILRIQLFPPALAREFIDRNSSRLTEFSDPLVLGRALVQADLLTSYQLDRILVGTVHGLILGNYKVRERLGAGTMGVVFLAEHYLMKRRVAIKVLPVDESCAQTLLDRFYSEILVLAELHHPNIVMAHDAGELLPSGPRMPALLYLVMEFIDGGDLEKHVMEHGRADIPQGCDWIRQAACGLQEAHDHHLIHRDLKPSNLLLTRQGQVKLVDFGLVRQFSSVMTSPRVLLGSVEFMSPEQSRDPTTVGAQSDIYGLGASLFWFLTGELPFPRVKSLAAALRALQQERPRRLRTLRPDAPEELDDLVDRMLDPDPERRPTMPITIMNALTPFCTRPTDSVLDLELENPIRQIHQATRVENGGSKIDDWAATVEMNSSSESSSILHIQISKTGRRVLIVDDDPAIRELCTRCLERQGYQCEGAETVAQALEVLRDRPCEVVLVDLKLPDKDGYELCRTLRGHPYPPSLRVIVVSGVPDQTELSEALIRGADDYLPKPFVPRELLAKVRHAFTQKNALDQYDNLHRHLLTSNVQLEHSLVARGEDIRQAQNALLFAMAKLAESRDGETAGHMRRLQKYVRCLGEKAAENLASSGPVNPVFLDEMSRCVPLHDIGKLALPDSVLLKPGVLDRAERAQMERHTLIGFDMLESLGRVHGPSIPFLGMAMSIVRSHHERFDGKGYPDHLQGDNIPEAARIAAMADVYDALRRQRHHKPALPHAQAVRQIMEGSPGQFDPFLLRTFSVCEGEFERIFRDVVD
ncbi:MAG TPA: protein kinase [Gemmataceae bacterium]|nr:protein kinase [Gemmataceae bacterium]